MKGHVKTPPKIADRMVQLLFADNGAENGDRILYPGCGSDGPFISAVSRYCEEHGRTVPTGIAFETHPERISEAANRHENEPVEFRQEDFLQKQVDLGQFDYIIGNPPYVPIEDIDKKEEYRERFDTAKERFDLYLLFFEQALTVLADDGRLCFITPEKFEYTETASVLRRLLTERHVERIEHLPESLFTGYATYPTITVIDDSPFAETHILRRDGSEADVSLPTDGSSWAPYVRDVSGEVLDSDVSLGQITDRISAGMATGRDAIFVQSIDEVPPQLIENGWTHPTTSAKQLGLNDGPHSDDVIICPYREDGTLVSEDDLGVFGEWAELHQEELEKRSCVKNGKPWYGWHENPPMDDIIGKPKLLCRDVVKVPKFWIDEEGTVLPRHSVYYLIPDESVDVHQLLKYLNSEPAQVWLEANCQRASNGYIRLQSKALQKLPVPEKFGDTIQTKLA